MKKYIFIFLTAVSLICLGSCSNLFDTTFDYGHIKRNEYVNDYFKLKLPIPKDYTIANRKQIDSFAGLAKLRKHNSSDTSEERIWNASKVDGPTLIEIENYQDDSIISHNSNLMSIVDNVTHSYSILRGRNYLDIMEKGIRKQKKFVIDDNNSSILIADKKFDVLGTYEISESGDTIHQKYLCTIRKGFSFIYVLTYVPRADLIELNKILAGSSFDK